MLEAISKSFIHSKSSFSLITPSPLNLFKLPWLRFALIGKRFIKGAIDVKNGKNVAEAIGCSLGSGVLNTLYINRCRNLNTRAYNCASMYIPNLNYNGLGATRRSWIDSKDKGLDGRIIKKLIMVYHDASIKHVDVHLGHLSMVYRITGKPIESQIKFNSKGMLTEDSIQALLNHVRSEIKKNARVPWNHDHTIANAKVQWAYDPTLKARMHYGSGPTRQVFLEDKVEFYHPEVTSSLHMCAPKINADQGLYIYQIYPGNGKSAPILIWGNLIPLDDNYPDRLHLKLIPTLEEFKSKVDIKTTTIKEDGASCYFSSNGQGFKFFSPRFSKVTNHRIEYGFKLTELADKGHPMCPQGMAELLFYKNFFGLKQYLSSAEIGGILNSNQVRPRNIYPDLKVYRMDKWNNKSVIDLPFFENRKLQLQMIKNLGGKWNIVKLAKPIYNNNIEGYVATINNGNILEGSKVKFKDNEFDWKIDSINLSITDKNRIAGVISCTSLESGKHYNLGPGSIGTQNECIQMINKPLNYIGKVIKVSGYRQHEGRAAKLIEYHLDK